MGRVKEMLIDNDYNDRQVEIAKYELNNLKRLNQDLIAVNEAIMKAYSSFGEMPTSIKMLSQDDFNAVEDLCIEINNRLDYAKTYLNDIVEDINEYYKPYEYKQHKEATSSEAIDKQLRKFVADNVEDVEVCASGINNEVEHGFIKNKDLDDLKEAISRPYHCTKNFRSI